MKRLVVISDLHCGHRSGLTPPTLHYDPDCLDHDRQKFADIQQKLWAFYTETVKQLMPIDILVVNGDAIDGKGDKSGGTEQLELDLGKQVDIATECIELVKAKKIIIIAGTPYHVGSDSDYERDLADKVDACKFGGEEYVDINGLMFNFRHRISRSSIPHGRFTMLGKEQLWKMIASEVYGWPKADVVVRSHAHYYVQSEHLNQLGFITPALQLHTKYGVRQATGLVDIGLISFDIENKEKYSWERHLLNLASVPPAVVKL